MEDQECSHAGGGEEADGEENGVGDARPGTDGSFDEDGRWGYFNVRCPEEGNIGIFPVNFDASMPRHGDVVVVLRF